MSRPAALSWIVPSVALVAGCAGMVGAWVAAGSLSGSSLSWLALVAALDVAMLLRLTQAPASRARILLAVLATGAIVVASQWLLAATRVGVLVGMQTLASAARLGPALGWQVVQLSLDRVDWVWLLASLPLAAILAEAPPSRPPDAG